MYGHSPYLSAYHFDVRHLSGSNTRLSQERCCKSPHVTKDDIIMRRGQLDRGPKGQTGHAQFQGQLDKKSTPGGRLRSRGLELMQNKSINERQRVADISTKVTNIIFQ